MTTFLKRYLAGDHERVWAELVDVGPDVRAPHVLPDAVEVARETMRRANENVETLVTRLRAIGYRFGTFADGAFTPTRPHRPPTKTSVLKLRRLERLVGPLPLSVQAWYEIVGSVHLVGQAPWGETNILADALLVDPIDVPLYSVQEWLEEWKGVPAELIPTDEPCLAWLAPDEYHKEDISGGPPYSYVLPDLSADAYLHHEWHETTFVAYLRECFACGGFPGLARLPGGLPQQVLALSASLTPL